MSSSQSQSRSDHMMKRDRSEVRTLLVQDCIDSIVEGASANPSAMLRLRLLSSNWAASVGNVLQRVFEATRAGEGEDIIHLQECANALNWPGGADGIERLSRVAHGLLLFFYKSGWGAPPLRRLYCVVMGMIAIPPADIRLTPSLELHLRELDVANTETEDAGAVVAEIARRCPQLEHLNAFETAGNVTDDAIKAVAEHCPQLKFLDVSDSGGEITDESIVAVAEGCPHLQHLAVVCTEGMVTDESLKAVGQHCPDLRYLDVSQTDGAITDAGLQAVAEGCPQLQHLDISMTGGALTDTSIQAIANGCPRLEYLNVSMTDDAVTDASLVAIARGCPKLQNLTAFTESDCITDVSVLALAKHCRELRNVSFGSAVTAAAAAKLPPKCSRLLQHRNRCALVVMK